MTLFSQQFISRHQSKLLFIVIWLHVSLLNTINVSGRGPLFLWHENSQLHTVVTNITVTIITLACYLLIKKIWVFLHNKQSSQS